MKLSRSIRDTGSLRSRAGYLDHEPLCFVQAFDLREEIQEARGDTSPIGGDAHVAVIRNVMERERCCEKFIKWQQGFPPKEHREMLDRQWMIDREDRRALESHEWQERQEEKAEARHQEQLAQLRSIHTQEMLVVGGLVTLTIVVITLVGAAIEARWIPKYFGI